MITILSNEAQEELDEIKKYDNIKPHIINFIAASDALSKSEFLNQLKESNDIELNNERILLIKNIKSAVDGILNESSTLEEIPFILRKELKTIKIDLNLGIINDYENKIIKDSEELSSFQTQMDRNRQEYKAAIDDLNEFVAHYTEAVKIAQYVDAVMAVAVKIAALIATA